MKTYSKSALQSANKKLIAIVAVALALIAIASILLGVGFGVYGTDTSKWFKSQSVDDNAPQEPQVDNNFVASVQSTNGISLLSAPATIAEDGETTVVRVTATVLPETAPQEVDWTVSFANPSSAWAKGKNVNDYVTVTPTADGAKTADVAVVKAFGEQVIVTVTSRNDNTKTATITADYVTRYILGEIKAVIGQRPTDDAPGYLAVAETNTSAGTIDNTVRTLEFRIKYTFLRDLYDRYRAHSSASSIDQNIIDLFEGYTRTEEDIVISDTKNSGETDPAAINLKGLPFFIDNGVTGVIDPDYSGAVAELTNFEKGLYNLIGITDEVYASLSISTKNALNKAFIDVYKNPLINQYFTLTAKIQSPNYTAVERSLESIEMNLNALPVYVDSVSVDVSNIVF